MRVHQKPASERGQGRQREKERARRGEAKGANRRAEARHAKERRRQRTLVPNPPSTSSIPGLPTSSTCNMLQSSSDEFEDDTVDPTEIFSLEDYLAQQNTLNNFAAQIATNIHDALAAPSTRRRSAPRTYIDRKREFYNQLLIADYFSDNPTYPDYYFRRRFRMGKPLFLRIVQALGEWSPYFTQRVDALGRPSLSPLQKCTAAMHMLAYGVPTDKTDDHIRLGASTTLKCLENFAKGVTVKFGGEYLRRLTVEDIQRLLEIGEARG